jgi:hypothetical protein
LDFAHRKDGFGDQGLDLAAILGLRSGQQRFQRDLEAIGGCARGTEREPLGFEVGVLDRELENRLV